MSEGFSLGMTEGFINNIETAVKILRKVLSRDLQGQESFTHLKVVHLSLKAWKLAINYCIDRAAGQSCCQPQPILSLAEVETFQERPPVPSPNTTMVAAPLRHHQTKEDVQNWMSSLIFPSKVQTVSQGTQR